MDSSVPKTAFSITTPIYYVNDIPHIGSAYTTIAADVVARFQRLQGRAVRLVTGTDEHGQKIERTAAAMDRLPQQHCDLIAQEFVSLWALLNIQVDSFIRTTDPRHELIVQEFFQRVWERGDIYQGQQQGWYCVSCEEFKEERDLLADQHCPLHPNKQVEWRDEQNYFFRLSSYQSRLEQLYASQPDFIQPESRRNEVLSFVAQGLQDFSISRVNVAWGIPLPVEPTQTIYVWFDALLAYLTALLEPDQAPTLANATAHWYPFNIHLIGKDILRFHAVYWPAMLMSAGLPLPARVYGHGFLTKDGQKISKTLGNVIDPVDLVNRYSADAVRYYFLKEIEFGRDGDFSEERFVNTLNADLANDLGNLLNRTLRLAHKYCNQKVPSVQLDAIPLAEPLRAKAEGLGAAAAAAYGQLAFSQVCEAALGLARSGNKYVDEQAPWALAKQGKQNELEQVLYAVLESVRLAAYLLSPIVPTLSNAVYQQLGFEANFNQPEIGVQLPFEQHAAWGALPPGQALGQPEPVFQRLELTAV